MRSVSTFLRLPNRGLSLKRAASRQNDFHTSILGSIRLYRSDKGARALELEFGSYGVACRGEDQELVDDLVTVANEPRVGTSIAELSPVTSETDGESKDQEDGELRNAMFASRKRWFPHLGKFGIPDEEGSSVSAEEVVEMLGSSMTDDRKQRIEKVIASRTYSVPVVIEGLSDVGNASAVCRTADALGFQSVHVIANKRNWRYRESPRTSMGAEKWLDVEKWESTSLCLEALKDRGYRIAVTHIAPDTVSIHDVNWTIPTAIVLGNEVKGITEEALALSDVRCCIPMAGMVESFNVSVAAAIIMHQAATDRLRRQGFHGDLSEMERSILAAEFFMRHRNSSRNVLETLVARRAKRSGNRLKPEIIEIPELVRTRSTLSTRILGPVRFSL